MHSYHIEATSALAIDGVFNGRTCQIGRSPATIRTFSAVFNSDVASAADGAKIQASQDGSAWTDVAVGTLEAGKPTRLESPPCGKYMRTVLVNGAAANTDPPFISTQLLRS